MENRRSSENSQKPFNQKNNFQKSANKPVVSGKFQSREDNFQPRNNRFQKRDENPSLKNDKFHSANTRPQARTRLGVSRVKDIKSWGKIERPPIVSDLQITDGKYYGRYLQGGSSPVYRTTSRRIREVMFKILLRRVRAGRFLDLFAGAGTVGIEAVSRGALIGTFVERSARLCSLIKKNLAALNIKEGHGEVFQIEVLPFLKQMEKRRRFWDVIFFAPPFDANFDEILEYFSGGAVLRRKGVLVIEHPSEMFFPEKIGVLNRWRVIAQEETTLSFYERR